MYQFSDSQFMTAQEKALVLKDWETFLKNGLQQADFTDRLYKHLTLHCSFIAHFNIHGFYETYFASPEQALTFLSQFDREQGTYSVEYGDRHWLQGEYSDINAAMVDIYTTYKKALYATLQDAKTAKWQALVQSVERAKTDEGYRNELLKALELI